jgi:CheY-like chemotaxis protein
MAVAGMGVPTTVAATRDRAPAPVRLRPTVTARVTSFSVPSTTSFPPLRDFPSSGHALNAPRQVILIAEDDASVRMTLEFVLEDEGYDVVCVEDGEEALRVARDRLPDLILLDQKMPKMEGKEVLSALKVDGPTADIPVLVLTGMERGTSNDWHGATFVGKPFSPDELIQKIRTALSR